MALDLVIGIGNPLRGDDGVGPHLAATVAASVVTTVATTVSSPGSAGHGGVQVQVLVVHQLTPELAEPLSEARRALFLDAWLASTASRPCLQPLRPAPHWEGSSHRLTPAVLLGLADLLYGATPTAQLLLVPAFVMEPMAEGFSPPLRRGLPRARRLLAQWLASGGDDA